MIILPTDFDVTALVADFYHLISPFVDIALLIATYTLISRLLRRA